MNADVTKHYGCVDCGYIAHIRKMSTKKRRKSDKILLFTFPSLLTSCFETRNKKSKATEK